MASTRIENEKVRQRLSLIRSAKKLGVCLACDRMGKQRSFYYYWFKRYKRSGVPGLYDQSRRPKRSPRRTPIHLERAVLRMRKRSGYGKERIHEYLKDQRILVPVSTIGAILNRAGLVFRRRKWKTQKKHTRCYNLLYPGQRVQMDIKYVPYRIKGRQFYQYTIIDENTRMRYLEWHDSIWVKTVVDVLKRSKTYFRFRIDSVQTDNGIEFTFNYTAKLTAENKEPVEHPLDVYCKTAKIRHKLIPPGEKEINGKVERSHRTDDEEFYRRHAKFKSLNELRSHGLSWMNDYNFKRKHWGIGKMTPAQFRAERLKMFPDRILQ